MNLLRSPSKLRIDILPVRRRSAGQVQHHPERAVREAEAPAPAGRLQEGHRQPQERQRDGEERRQRQGGGEEQGQAHEQKRAV